MTFSRAHERQPIRTAPRDGRVIIVGHEDVGQFAMAWNPLATNPVFAPGETGMWEMFDKSMTWKEGEDGPEYWFPYEEPVA